jgi:hypothetical protein
MLQMDLIKDETSAAIVKSKLLGTVEKKLAGVFKDRVKKSVDTIKPQDDF